MPDSPNLIFAERVFRSGYAPRAILLSAYGETLFVGTKEGTVTVVSPQEDRAETDEPLNLADFDEPRTITIGMPGPAGSSPVRALCELDEQHLLVGRGDGAVFQVAWKRDQATQRKFREPTGPLHPVRSIVRLRNDSKNFAVSVRGEGVHLLSAESGELAPIEELRVPGLTDVRHLLPLRAPDDPDGPARWLLVTDLGDYVLWDGPGRRPVDGTDPWRDDERPGLVCDYGLIRSETDRKKARGARAALLATDRAVYRIEIDPRSPDRLLRRRVPLPGLSGMATAVTYTEDSTYRYLWVADSWGNSHLYWSPATGASTADKVDQDPRHKPGAYSFRSSGVMQARSEVLLCFLWTRRSSADRPDLLFGQARRNDQIVLGRYWDPEIAPGVAAEGGHEPRYRSLLTRGIWSGKETTASELPGVLREALDGLRKGRREQASHKPVDDEERAEALLTELFERLGESEEDRALLFDALRSPQSEVADRILASGDPETVSDAGRLWTQALLGVIHRSTGNRHLAYLGLLQWLRRRQERVPWTARSRLQPSLQTDIGFARKWGLSGEANADRSDLVRPLEILYEQDPDDGQGSGRQRDPDPDSVNPAAVDRLSYESLLFHRSVSLLEHYQADRLRGRTAWDLSVFKLETMRESLETTVQDLENRRLAAISWMWGGVDVFEVTATPGEPSGSRLNLRLRLPPAPTQEPLPEPIAGPDHSSEIRQEKWGYSRAVHVGAVGGTLYVLTAPAREEGETEFLQLWTLQPPTTADGRWNARPARSFQVPEDDSVYSLHELERGWLVVGLRGVSGIARIAELRLRNDSHSNLDLQASELTEPIKLGHGPARRQAPEAGTSRRNRVWSLDSKRVAPKGPEDSTAATHRVVVGTEAGNIYRVSLTGPPDAAHRERSGIKIEEIPSSPGSPVLCIEYREPEPGRARLYAGCEDGSILAWQELAGQQDGPDEPDEERARFGVLWATQEQGPIAELHHFKFPRDGNRLKWAILVVTRQGRTVLLDDRDRMETNEPGSRPSRFPVPGSRFGRLALPASAFAAALWVDGFALSDCATEKLGAYGTLLAASGEGTVALVSLHTPAKTQLRKDRYGSILALWCRVVRKGVDWRLGEALFRASPILSLITVRWLLDPAFPHEKMKELKELMGRDVPEPHEARFQAWWLPHHLRPLRQVRRNWLRWDPDQPLSAVKGDAQDGQDRTEPVGSALEAALRRSWRLDDLELFQEIACLALKRANFEVYRMTRAESVTNLSTWELRSVHGALQKLYDEVYLAVERSLQLWLGAPERKEARARAAVAKHMVDGDTAWRLFLKSAKERAESQSRGKERAEEESYERREGPLEQILQRRVTGVRELVHKRDPLVSLEALRAANLSLTRLCWRLVDERTQGGQDATRWRPTGRDEPSDFEIHWPVFQPYFERLTAAAERAFGARQQQIDALAHEHTRTFALAICACPSAAIRIANRLTETRLIRRISDPDDLSQRILRQLDVLSRIGIPAPVWAVRLFRLVTRMPESGEDLNPVGPEALRELDLLEGGECRRGRVNDDQVEDSGGLRPSVFYEDGVDGRIIKGWRGKVGIQNAEDLCFLTVLHEGVTRWFVDLARRMATDARDLDLSPAVFESLEKRLKQLETETFGPSGRDLFSESRTFWADGLSELKEGLQSLKHPLKASAEKVRPEAVLVSPVIAEWARSMQADLARREQARQIYVPELTIFRRILSDLEVAAREFPGSAAVQKNIVRGILGHHLLEDLDEHVLELGEIAQALDPMMAQRFAVRSPGSPVTNDGDSVASRFAAYLVQRSQSAEGIPKNLRMLQTLLASPLRRNGEREGNRRDLFSPYRGRWDNAPETTVIGLGEDELACLRLTLEELDQNQQKHSELDPKKYSPRVEDLSEDGFRLTFPFSMEATDPEEEHDNFKRLSEIHAKNPHLQTPWRPRKDGVVTSTGAGLYLANLAASVVSWSLTLEEPRELSDRSRGECSFRLEKLAIDPEGDP